MTEQEPEHEDQAAAPTSATCGGSYPQGEDDAAELAAGAGQREELAAEVALYADRAEASMQAIGTLERERLEGLAAGRDMQGLRERRRNAEEDAKDAVDAARFARGRLDAVDKQIAAVQQRMAIAALGAELAEAVKARDAVLAATGERQRTAVLAVRMAAEEFTAALADERAATERVEQLAAQIALGGPMPVVPSAASTALWMNPADYVARAPVALMRAMNEARAGNIAAVAELLGQANGFLPPSREKLAAEAERMRALYADQPAQPARPAQQVTMDPRFGASHGVDRHGNALPPPPPATPDRPRQQVVRPGSLGFQPFPR